MFVSKESINKAKGVNLINFLKVCYPEAIEYSDKQSSYRNPKHDSLVINKELWHRFSSGDGGDQIQYLINYCGKNFQEAVSELCDFADAQLSNQTSQPCSKNALVQQEINVGYIPPAKHSNNKAITKYLQTRAIPLDTIQMLISSGLLYEDRRHNCVFQRKNPGMCIVRGTSNEKWSQIIREIPNSFWYFKIGENPENIFICESPIDSISLYECNLRRSGYYCAMGGLKKNTYLRILDELAFDENGNLIKNIKIGVDWDAKGEHFLKHEIDATFPFVAVRPKDELSITKDWNDVLRMRFSENKSMTKAL